MQILKKSHCYPKNPIVSNHVHLKNSFLQNEKLSLVHGPAESQFNFVIHEVRFEKFECNYRCTINSMNSVFVAENANGPWELSDSMYQMPKKKKSQPTEFQTKT